MMDTQKPAVLVKRRNDLGNVVENTILIRQDETLEETIERVRNGKATQEIIEYEEGHHITI